MAVTRLTIGRLAGQAGVSVQTLRHYHRLGLLEPSAVSAGGYRLYGDDARVRLDLIRALRALDFDLRTIGRLLRGAASMAEAAALQLAALDVQAAALARRRAVLRAVVRPGTAPSAQRLARLQVLASLERADRERFLAEQLDRRLAGTHGPAALRSWVREAAMVDLPDSPTEAQVDAWLELAELVTDPGFLARHRAEEPPPWARATDVDPARWRRDTLALYEPAAAAAERGVDPRSAAGRPIVRRWVRWHAARAHRRDLRAFAGEMLRGITARHDEREARFWELVGVLKPEVARSPVAAAWPWLVEGLRGWVEETRSPGGSGQAGTSRRTRDLSRRHG